jgi:hypothetical protein
MKRAFGDDLRINAFMRRSFIYTAKQAYQLRCTSFALPCVTRLLFPLLSFPFPSCTCPVGITVGLLGMTFKANIDDIRHSLSYKIRKVLLRKGATVLCTDPYLQVGAHTAGSSVEIVPLDAALTAADGFILATPHDEYKPILFSNLVAQGGSDAEKTTPRAAAPAPAPAQGKNRACRNAGSRTMRSKAQRRACVRGFANVICRV